MLMVRIQTSSKLALKPVARSCIRWLWLLASLQLVAGPSHANEQDYYKKASGLFTAFVKEDNTPLRSAPSLEAPVIWKLSKGMILERSNIITPSELPKGGVEPDMWIQRKGGIEATDIGKTTKAPDGWLQRRDVLTPDEFKPIDVWPIKTYWDDYGDDRFEYRFKPDGSSLIRNFVYADEQDRGKWRDFGRVRVAHGMVILGAGINLLGSYDVEKKVFYCGNPKSPFYTTAYDSTCRDRQTRFSDQEIAAFFKKQKQKQEQ